MKLIVRSMIVLLFLTALAMPVLAQNPHLAVRISPPSSTGKCFGVTITNLRSTPLGCSAAYLTVVDKKTCKITCDFKVSISREIGACKEFRFKICCDKPLPAEFIANVRVNHALGNNEQWFFGP